GGAALLLEINAIPFMLITYVFESAHSRHVAAASKLNVIAAQKFVFLAESPPRHVHVHAANPVVIVDGHVLKLRKISSEIATDGVGQITSDDTGRVGYSIGEGRRTRIEQDACRLASTRRHHDSFGIDALFGTSGLVDIGDSFGFSVVANNDLA